MRNIYSCFLFQILTEEVELYKSIKSIIKTTLQYYIYIYIISIQNYNRGILLGSKTIR